MGDSVDVDLNHGWDKEGEKWNWTSHLGGKITQDKWESFAEELSRLAKKYGLEVQSLKRKD